MSGDVFGGHNRGRLLLASSRKKGVAEHLQCTGQPPTTKNYPAKNVNSVKVKKS